MIRYLMIAYLLMASSFVWSSAPSDSYQTRLACLGNQVSNLAKDTKLLAAVNNYNSNPPDPQQLDKEWSTHNQSSPFLKQILDNDAADNMRKWIHRISIQGEGLLIGRNGGLVSATEKTTDYWQGDEAQYLKAISLRPGEVFMQNEMLDESTHLMLIKVSSPIYNPRSKHAIGVLVIGFDQFVIDFIEPCN